MGIIDINNLITTAQKAKAETDFETKIALFTDIVTTMWDKYSSDLKKTKIIRCEYFVWFRKRKIS